MQDNSNIGTDYSRPDWQNETIKQILLRNLVYWPLFVLMISVFLFCAWIYIRYTIPVYESKATLLIKDEKKGIDDSRLLASIDQFSSSKILENEIEVLRSRMVMKEVVKKLHLYAPITYEGSRNYLSAYVESPVKVQLKDPDHLTEYGKIDFDYLNYNGVTKLVVLNNERYPLNVWINSKWGMLKFLPNDRYTESNEKRKMFFSLIDVRNVADGLLGSLVVEPTSKLSTMIVLTIKDPVRERGEDVLNALMEEYNQAAIEDKNKLASNALSFIEQRLHYVVGELDSVEMVIQHFKTSKEVVDISEQGKLFLQSVETNDKRIGDVNIQLTVLDQVEKYIKTKDKNLGIVPSIFGLNDDILSQLLTKLYDAEMEYERLKRITAENNPILASLQNQIEKMKHSIMENIENHRNSLEASKGNLEVTSDRYYSLLKGIPQKERQLLDITRQQSIKNNIYIFLLQKREEAALSLAASVSDSRLIDNAASGRAPVSPNQRKIYAMAFFMGLIIPVGFVGLKELLNETIQSKAEIEAFGSFPVLGEISYHKSKSPFVMLDNEKSFAAEQIRLIRTSLSCLVDKPGSNKLLITSTSPAEGKSFVAVNLAISLALTDKKVVLVDLDLRRPGLSQLFKLKSTYGMSDYLKKNAETSQVILETTITENLFLIPAGEPPAYPSELISNARMEALLNALAKKFDYIIIETPPVNTVTDAYIVAKYCDATLFIVRQHKTLKEDILQLRDTQKIRSLGNVGIVFNGIKAQRFGRTVYKKAYAESK